MTASHTPCAQCRSPRQAGFSLVELMIAITISLLLTVALIGLLLNINRTNTEMAKANVQIENGRFAIQILQNDLAHAGFWGQYIPDFDDLSLTSAPADTPDDVPDPCKAFATWDADDIKGLIGIPLQTYEATPAGCATLITHKKADTDILVVRHAETCLPGDANCDADVAGRLYFQASLCEDEITAGQRYVLNTTNFTLQNKGCDGVAAAKRRFISHIYYVRDYAVSEGDGIPTLMRAEFDLVSGTPGHKVPVALIEGIEGFRVELGIDNYSDAGTLVDHAAAVSWADPTTRSSPVNRGDGIADGAFIRCTTAVPCTVDKLMNTVAAKLYILVRNRDKTPGYNDEKTYQLGATSMGPFDDEYKRHVFSTSVRLTNISGRRETP